MGTLPVKRKRQSGRLCSEAKINNAGVNDENGKRRMCGMKHNYNGHKMGE